MKLYSTKEKFYFLKGKVGAKELTVSVTMSYSNGKRYWYEVIVIKYTL